MRFNLVFLVFVSLPFLAVSQTKYERETRIERVNFPSEALKVISPYLEGAKRLRFYRETDSSKVSYEAKFKKDRLLYSVEFDKLGNLEDVEFLIKKNDIPEDSWTKLTNWLEDEFGKVKIKKIQQQYPVQEAAAEERLKQAFQNLILPYIRYELIFSAKKKSGYQIYEGLFDANWNNLSIRRSIKPEYDHILY